MSRTGRSCATKRPLPLLGECFKCGGGGEGLMRELRRADIGVAIGTAVEWMSGGGGADADVVDVDADGEECKCNAESGAGSIIPGDLD